MKNLTAAVLLAGVTFVTLSNAGSGSSPVGRSAPTTPAADAAVPVDDAHQRFDQAR